MARHVIVSTAATATYTNGLLANGAIDVQKMSSNGPTKLVPGETLTDAAQIRIVQGTTTQNIVTPWFYGKDVINWGGRSYAAATAKDETYTISALTATAAGEATIKVSNQTNGVEPFNFKSWTVSYAIGATATTIADALKNFPGVQRRFEILCQSNSLVIVDDYGHHPTEILATLATAKTVWPDRKLVVVFPAV